MIHRFDEDGFLYIGGRQKEIIVTGGGENVAPVPIEDMIKVQRIYQIQVAQSQVLFTQYQIHYLKYQLGVERMWHQCQLRT